MTENTNENGNTGSYDDPVVGPLVDTGGTVKKKSFVGKIMSIIRNR